MFSWTLRIAGWIIGIYAMLKLAAATGTVTYTKVFQAWLDQLHDFLGLGFILKPLTQAVILPALDFIRSFDIPIPALQDHWQQVFVLTWLMLAASARNLSGSVPTFVVLGLAFFCSLPFCVAAGTKPVGSVAVLFLPVGSLVAFVGILSMLRGDWRGALSFASLAAVIAAVGLVSTTRVAADVLVVLLAVVFGGVMFFVFVFRLLFGKGSLSQRFQDPDAATGLDITAALLGAFGLATAFADPPLF
jgi:hypothetical protein